MSEPYTFVYKRIPLECLRQDTHWYDRKGKLYEIESMSRNHVQSAMRLLVKQFGLSVMHTAVYKALKKKER